MKRTAIDLFAGAGGFSLGVKKAGFKLVLAVENDKYACDTYHRNHKDTFLLCDDIKNVTGNRIFSITKLKKRELDFLFGGPPCQGFTFISSKRSIDDPRSKLMHEFIRLVDELQPKIFMIENIPGLFGFKDFFYLLMETLENIGFNVRCLMMDACSYQVPQYRKRIFIQGVRKDLNFLPSFPSPQNFDLALDKKFNKMFPPSQLAIKCFAKNGFAKEEVKDLYWNNVLWIQMNKKTAADVLDNAINELMFETIKYNIKKTPEKLKKLVIERSERKR